MLIILPFFIVFGQNLYWKNVLNRFMTVIQRKIDNKKHIPESMKTF
jgi:hypothetical protein